MAYSKVAIIGGTGNIGKPITHALIEKGFQVLVISRDSKKAKELFGERVKYAELQDYNNIDEITKVFQGYEVVLSALGSQSGAILHQKQLIDAAKKANVKRFIPSEWAWDNSITFMVAEKNQIRHHLEQSGLEWTYFQTGYFSEYIWSNFFGWDIKNNKFQVVGNEDTKISHTDMATIGKYAAAFLNHPSSKNKTVYVATETLTYGQAEEQLEQITGKSITVEYTDPEPLKQKFEKEGKSLSNFFDQLKYDIGTSRTVIEHPQNKEFPEIKGKTYADIVKESK
eukprot:NODE_466_length_7077_cov_0.565205.p2 type:complete len:283 gc:universal NODE_466_length_7077_cov_0.565205:290-1138(+)